MAQVGRATTGPGAAARFIRPKFPLSARACHAVAEALLRALKDHGAGEIFGIPGDFILPFFKFIEDSEILPLYTLSHEPGVGFAADAAGRYRGQALGVAAVTFGAGGFNLVNATGGAYAEKSPLVVLAGGPGTEESNAGLLLHHQAKALDSQLRVYREVTCDHARLDDPLTAPALIGRVLRNCRELSRPVYLELPRDLPGMNSVPVPPSRPMPYDPEAVAACAEDILDRLARAAAPVIGPITRFPSGPWSPPSPNGPPPAIPE
ncbi:MAG: thiamine pyrophosphate-binding protein [Acetobacteraceae bacterium]